VIVINLIIVQDSDFPSVLNCWTDVRDKILIKFMKDTEGKTKLKRDDHESMSGEQVGANPGHKRTCVRSQFW
jgi:hypothetical protein